MDLGVLPGRKPFHVDTSAVTGDQLVSTSGNFRCRDGKGQLSAQFGDFGDGGFHCSDTFISCSEPRLQAADCGLGPTLAPPVEGAGI